MVYLILHRAISNFGDFLMFERGRELISSFKKGDVLTAASHKPLENQLSLNDFSNVNAVILPGGPGLVRNMYPHVYSSFRLIREKRKPIFFLGIGQKIHSYKLCMDKLNVDFSKDSIDFLRYAQKFAPIGVRDFLSQNIIRKFNFRSRMNGCLAFYDLNKIGINKVKKLITLILKKSYYQHQLIHFMSNNFWNYSKR